jgi:predicted acyltransferase
MTTMSQPTNRLLSLDVLRGITIAGMIMVNNPGSWSYVYAPLGHAAWHGLTPTDLVFPFFMFIMGISTFISLRKFNFEWSRAALLKILKRTVVIFLIGMGIAWLSLSFRTFRGLEAEELGFFERFIRAITNFEKLRILGVLQRLALSYGATAIIAILVKHKYIPHIIIVSLVGYFFMLLFGNGFDFSEQNIIAIVDQAVLGVNHMYRDSGVYLDPEGLLSTIPSIAHVLIGFLAGKMLMQTKDNHERIQQLFIMGAILTFAGFLLSYGCPINKKIWSPTFVLVTCGLAATLLALLVWIIDIKGHKRWSRFFVSFCVYPLFFYLGAAVFYNLFGNILIKFFGELI